MKERVIPALDTQSDKELNFLIKELSGEAEIVKIGMESFYTYGSDIITRLKGEGFRVFLDLKMHDIPSTVGRASKTLGKLGVDILNVHCAGGLDMMRAGLEGFSEGNNKGIMIGVTQLTSTSQSVMNKELLISGTVQAAVLSMANTAKSAGLHGVVCSAHEISIIKENLGNDFKTITPGIRPKGISADDQKRIMTPAQAIGLGSDYLVIGRAITQAASPKLAFQNIIKDIE